MKIYLVTNGLTSGGSERVLSLLANSLSTMYGYHVEVIVLMGRDVFYSIDSGVKLVFAEDECASKSIAKKIIWLRKYLKTSKPDVIIAFLNRVYSLTALASVGLNIPIIASERNDPRHFSFFYKILIRLTWPLIDHMVVQTQYIKEYYPKYVQRKMSIIVNPVNDDVWSIKIASERERKDIIISVGRLYPQKNQKMLIDAFFEIHKKFPTYKLHIYGEGILRNVLEDKIKEKHLEDSVLLMGRSHEILEKMNESKLLCMTSIYEGMSNVMMEAICIGLPVITTKVSGTDELLEDAKNGYVVEQNDVENFIKKTTKVISDKELYNQLSKNCIVKSKKFESSFVFSQWNDLINKIRK